MSDDESTPFTYDATVLPTAPEMPALLASGEVEVLGLMPWSSNGTYLVDVKGENQNAPAIYKPAEGERPLWDFPEGLWQREVAAYELSAGLGIDLVPVTVARSEAPFGEGSLQAFIPARFEEHYFTIRESPKFVDQLQMLCAFDIVANSTDRKSGHCLVDGSDHVWAIDNGLSFHEEFKVRTVIWDFAREPLPSAVIETIAKVIEHGPPAALADFLSASELTAVSDRAEQLLALGFFPDDPSGRSYPWPLV